MSYPGSYESDPVHQSGRGPRKEESARRGLCQEFGSEAGGKSGTHDDEVWALTTSDSYE